MIAVNWL